MYLFDCYVPAHYFFSQIVDYAIARSIVDLHMGRHGAEDTHTIYSVDNIRRYIAFARCFKPKVWNNFFHITSVFTKLCHQDNYFNGVYSLFPSFLQRPTERS